MAEYSEDFDKCVDAGDMDAAMAVLEKASAHQYENTFYLSNMGWVMIQLDRYSEAVSYLAKAISLFPEDAWNYSQLGVAYQFLEDTDRAILNFEKSIKMGREDAWVFWRLALAYRDIGELDKAIGACQNVLMEDDTALYARTEMAQLYLRQKRYQEAVDEWLYVCRYEPSDDYLEACCHDLINHQQFSLVEKLVQRIENIAIKCYIQAIVAYYHNNFNEALSLANTCLNEGMDHTGVRQLLADAYYGLEQPEKAKEQLLLKKEYWLKALEKSPSDIWLLTQLAKLCSHLEEYEEAIEFCKRGIEVEPDNAEIYSVLANCYAYLLDAKNALLYYKKLGELYPEYREVEEFAYNEAYCFDVEGKSKEAITLLQKYMATEHTFKSARMFLLCANLFCDGERYEEAYDISVRGLQEVEEYRSNLYKWKAIAAFYLKKYEEAIESANTAIKEGLDWGEYKAFIKDANKKMKSKK